MKKLKKLLAKPQQELIRDKKSERNLFARRALVSFIFVWVLTAILATNLYHLQIVNYDSYQTRSNGNRIKLLPLPPTRGLIYDRYGKLLAENLTFFGLYIVPEKVENLERTFEELKAIVGLTEEDIENFKKERRRASRYTSILLKPHLTEEQIARFSVNQYRFTSLEVKPYFKRHYLYGEPLTHILGYVAKINDKDVERLKKEGKFANYAGTHDIGKLGIERYYETQLHGSTGFEEVEVNNRGKVIRKLREQPAIAGKSIHLTIDLELQRYITDLLSGQKGAVVVLDPKDNSILAMVSTPSYDNNLFVDGISSADYKRLLNDPNRPLYSRVTQGAYPPASTVKPFIGVAALHENVITQNMTIFDPGYWVLPNTTKRFRDWKKTGHGHTDLNKAIVESSDTYFYQTAYNMGIDRLSDWMKRFGFGVPTGIDIQEETAGIMPSREWKQKRHKRPWVQGDTISVGIGQGYWIATPLQVAKATSILINEGKVHTPHLMKSVEGSTVEPYQDPLLYEDITEPKAAYWDATKRGMYNVVNAANGTGRKAFIGTSYRVAGKSGTAQVFSLKENQTYDASGLKKELHDHAWFTAYAPYDDPKMVVAIILENAGGGSSVAAPVVRQIMDYYLTQRLPQISRLSPADSLATEDSE
ncbi:penicillin-binding protein 2 [Pasteurella multocida]|uniref:penicillin-binding protein 2 n=1 Tax=Pasteurella multocida TaxID=747 RepID=UPI000E06F311|nr:penicillin-binding protein 2 [Pasteurella multocida]MCL7786755.1 penicillin-binding protein 2 [Pasteurella multocida]MCL7795095.1 penicillin-binding protein 2 [Pasteurella multocida]URI01984.1 penicillin-binding protein 2 [Pasteurella multocida]SUB45572.1 penicillin-binding protein 2 [Pasteurella multocida subsp. septica]HDR1284518.1 penicillin-binding protein 2 [Pasteurella multocida]